PDRRCCFVGRLLAPATRRTGAVRHAGRREPFSLGAGRKFFAPGDVRDSERRAPEPAVCQSSCRNAVGLWQLAANRLRAGSGHTAAGGGSRGYWVIPKRRTLSVHRRGDERDWATIVDAHDYLRRLRGSDGKLGVVPQ